MFPLRDDIPSRSRPVITVSLIVINFLFFFQELTLSDSGLNSFIHAWGLIPAEFLGRLLQAPLQAAAYPPLFTSLFLHGGWMHIIGNMWYLWIFGDNIEDCLGKLRFIGFYLMCGLLANFAQVLVDPGSTVPSIGASGAISGVLGAYLRLYPRARITTLIPFFPFFVIQIPAMLFLAFWFLLQLQSGTLALFMAGANIAWWAHIGGFAAGFALARIVRPLPYK